MADLNGRIAEPIRDERAEQSPGNVDDPNPHFVGRATELRRLREQVGPGQIGVITAVQGRGGLGKTALAIEYAHTYAHDYPGGRWQVRCQRLEDLRVAVVSLAGTRGLEFAFTDVEKKNLDLGFGRVLRELKARAAAAAPGRALLILDDVDRPRLLEPAQMARMGQADWLHVIATTRLGAAELAGVEQDRTFVEVDELPEADALELIESCQPGGRFRDAAQHDAAVEIVHLLGRFPLAVEMAAVFLGQFTGKVLGSDFRDRLRGEGLTGLEAAASTTLEHVHHAEKSLRAAMAAILEQLGNPEHLALAYAALLPPDQVVLPWLRVFLAKRFPELGRDVEPGCPDPWQTVWHRLFRVRLLQATGVRDSAGSPLVARMHRLVQELVRQYQADRVKAREAAVLDHVKARAQFLWDGWVAPERRWELGPVAAYAWQALERGSGDGAYLAHFAASPLFELGKWAEAEPLRRSAVAIFEQTLGPDHPNVASALNNLAMLLRTTNRLGEAEPLYRRALAITERNLGPDHPKVAACLNNLASLLGDSHRPGDAEPFFRRALAIDEATSGPDHPRVAIRLNNLAQLLQALNRLDEAEPLFRRALAINEASAGPDHPRAAPCLHNLAALLKETGRLVEAEPFFRRTLAIWERSLGSSHPQVAACLHNLAELLRAANRPGEAEPLFRRALAIHERCDGPDPPEVARVLNGLAGSLLATNRAAEVEPLFRRALAIHERCYGPDHPEVAESLNNLAGLLVFTNRMGEALPLAGRELEILLQHTQATGREHPKLWVSIMNYKYLLTSMVYSPEQVCARLDEIGNALGLGVDPAGQIRRLRGPLGGPAATAPAVLPVSAEEYFHWGEECRARGMWDHALRSFSASISLKPHFALAYFKRGNIFLRMGRWDEAIADYTEATRLDPGNAAYHNNRGRARFEAQQFDQAIADYDTALQIDPGFVLAYSNRGLAREVVRDRAGALVDFARCVELEPSNPTYQNQLEVARRQQG